MPEDSHRCGERLWIVEQGFPVEADEWAARIPYRCQVFDCLEPIAPLPARMLIPSLDVGRPRDERFAIPEPDGVAVPLRDTLAKRELAAEMNDAPHVSTATAHEQHHLWRHHDASRFWPGGPLAHEPFGPAVRSRPLVRGIHTLVGDLPHHALLILRG